MNRKIASALAGLILFGLSAQASATTIIDTTFGDAFNGDGNGYSVDSDTGGGQSIGLPFSSPSATIITNITAYIGAAGSVDIGIMADSGGIPSGSFLFHQVVPLSNLNPVNLTSLNWSISGATTYWLVAISAAGTNAAWEDFTGNIGLFAYENIPSNNLWTLATDVLPEAIISSNEAATPLPAALPLFAPA